MVFNGTLGELKMSKGSGIHLCIKTEKINEINEMILREYPNVIFEKKEGQMLFYKWKENEFSFSKIILFFNELKKSRQIENFSFLPCTLEDAFLRFF